MKHSVDMSLPGIGEDFSLLDTIIAELPELFYAEILPKLDLRATLNLAQVNKTWRDAVWSVDGVRSMEAKYRCVQTLRIYPYGIQTLGAPMARRYLGGMARQRASGQGPPEVRGGREQTCFRDTGDPTVLRSLEGHLSIVALLLDAGANAREP